MPLLDEQHEALLDLWDAIMTKARETAEYKVKRSYIVDGPSTFRVLWAQLLMKYGRIPHLRYYHDAAESLFTCTFNQTERMLRELRARGLLGDAAKVTNWRP